MTNPEDKSLVDECLSGNTNCFETLVDRYYKVMFNVAFRMVNNLEDAKDITQTVFLKAYDKLDSYDPKHKFFSWIYRIAVNESLNLLNQNKPSEALDHNMVTTDESPEEQYDKNRLRESIQSAIMKLSDDHRQVIILRNFVGLSYQDISSVLDLPEKTVKSRLYSARRRLCSILMKRSAAR